jgi:hypothetical protein
MSDAATKNLPKPEQLPTPPVDYPLSKLAAALTKPARAVQEAFTPHTDLESLRSQLTAMAGPAAGLDNMTREALKQAGGLVGDLKTLGNEPMLTQPWWNAAVRTGTEALGAANVLRGWGRGGVGNRPIWKSTPKMASAAELPPPLPGSTSYRMQPPVSGEQYLDAFRKATAAKDEVSALNIVRNAAKNDAITPSFIMDVMKHPSPYVNMEAFRYMDTKLGGPPR